MRSLALFASAAALAASAACTGASAATVGDLALTEAPAAADSCAYTLSWKPVAANASGAPDGYLVQVTAHGAKVLTDTIAAPPVSIRLARPPLPDSSLVVASVAAIRRGTVYTAAVATAVCRGVDQPLPAPDSVRIDSTKLLVSARMDPDSLEIAPGDSARVTVIGLNPFGDTVHLASVEWSPGDSVITVRPIADTPSAWVIVSPTAAPDPDPGSSGIRLVMAPIPLSRLRAASPGA